ncbi:hypothetical protein G6F57_004418 [Rhizopus arrhizus]|uniref:Uncharacterized protein n=1 Tax=Rhizopus oryzae TaxID=64495 RepID=A0A9P6X2G8_RHIOR|nr:hypothetical protein G6F23_002052 [Rhizopus arrhizus]KAG1419600.1 hypothetical protein G6F58_004532 [Rhizopus delemar]KAG0765816.1 hypothetical protein G6F24_004109 [Rhizopus arrhizus]KAG0778302.1 hypothetical protein G6F22_011312 [Rhizopus arrhizus]KAG0789274.1 hypothetical protein G6F21_006627 [Rhizopus arrhizus]
MLDDLRKIYHDHNSSDENDIENILTKVNQKKRLSYNAWLTKATFEIEGDDDEDNDDKDDDDEDDDDEEYDDNDDED